MYGLGNQVIERPDYHGPSAIAPQRNPAVCARATTVLIRLRVVTVRVGRFVPVMVSAFIVPCRVVPPSRIIRAGRVFIGVVSSPTSIVLLPAAFLAVIADPPAAFFAVFVRPVTGVFCVGIPGVFRLDSARAGCMSSARPVRVSNFYLGEPQSVYCPAGATRTGKSGEDIFCGPPSTTVNGWEIDGVILRVRIYHINPGYSADRISEIKA